MRQNEKKMCSRRLKFHCYQQKEENNSSRGEYQDALHFSILTLVTISSS